MADNLQLLDRLLKLSDVSQPAYAAKFQATPVTGHPVFYAWGRWSGLEIDQEKGTKKAYLFLPYLSMPQLPIKKSTGAFALESPLELVLSEVDNPYNCKVKVTPSLNVSGLKEGSYYGYLLALKPAGYTSRGTVAGYWDGYLKSVSAETDSADLKTYLSMFNTVRHQWGQLLSQQQHDDDVSEDNESA